MNNINQILEERLKQHGDFSDQANLSQLLKNAFNKNAVKINSLTEMQREAIDMILHKIARIGSGTPNYSDHWLDIMGYCQLVLNHISEKTSRL